MSFFKRKSVKLPEPGEFKKGDLDDLGACGLSSSKLSKNDLLKRNEDFFEIVKTDLSENEDDNPVAIVCERLEQNFSSREISFLLAKTMITPTKS